MDAFKKAVQQNLGDSQSGHVEAVKMTDLDVKRLYDILFIKPLECRFGRSWMIYVLSGPDGGVQPVWANR
jgi:hypothetical protein